MFTYCASDFQMLFDLTGPDGWQENNKFIEKLNELANRRSISYVSNVTIIDENVALQLNPENIVDHIGSVVYDDLDTDESGVLMISNNAEHVRYWVEFGFSTVYLQTENCDLRLNLNYMPDEIWNYEHFYQFANNQSLRKSYASELIKHPNMRQFKPNLIKLDEKLSIPDTDYVADIIFTGRYYMLKDNRHYQDPLSRAIIGLKYENYYTSLAVKETLGKIIDTYVDSDGTVSQVVFVPPRPNKKSRFLGVEKFVESNIKLEYDLLRSTDDYPSPKDSNTFLDKYHCVHGHIECRRKISGHVLLVDDVFTSGATTAECARILYKSGADKVTILPIAFTQYFNDKTQKVLPVVFNEDGNEYHITFRKENLGPCWFSKYENGKYDEVDFDIINQKYLSYSVEHQEYSLDKRIDAVIFDLDNTLLHTDHLERYRFARKEVKDTSLLKKEHIIIDLSILEGLKYAGIKIGIVTRSPKNYATSLLNAYGYAYDYLLAAGDTFKGKPFPDPMLKCAQKLKVERNFTLATGDQDTDKKAAVDAGMMFVYVNEAKNILEEFLHKANQLPF